MASSNDCNTDLEWPKKGHYKEKAHKFRSVEMDELAENALSIIHLYLTNNVLLEVLIEKKKFALWRKVGVNLVVVYATWSYEQ
ncbi:hypothetical protein PVK06_035830 [Gossypium arboreum]|uniref:Uncharacterized protein n=1 Tax=Gossypium arboreum TaxID=29729 RepID=A0ABR0NHU8_GOSAR|nr:hypothetical protein PVK06_035830 [Gossypium arboreum]